MARQAEDAAKQAARGLRRSTVPGAVDLQAIFLWIGDLEGVEFLALRDRGAELVRPLGELGIAWYLEAQVQFGRSLDRFTWLEDEQHAGTARLVAFSPQAERLDVPAHETVRIARGNVDMIELEIGHRFLS